MPCTAPPPPPYLAAQHVSRHPADALGELAQELGNALYRPYAGVAESEHILGVDGQVGVVDEGGHTAQHLGVGAG